jgi:hypothetical protein
MQAGLVPSTIQAMMVTAISSDEGERGPQRQRREHQGGRHGGHAEPGELAQPHVGVVVAHDATPQQGGQGAGVGEVRVDVTPSRTARTAPGPAGAVSGSSTSTAGRLLITFASTAASAAIMSRAGSAVPCGIR